jgi:ribosome-associated protein
MTELGRLEKAKLILDAALDRKAENALVLDVREVTSLADTFILLTGRSDRQVRAIADLIEERLVAAGDRPLGVEGKGEAHWVLIDCNDVIVHVFDPETRDHYALDRLWSDVPQIDLGADADGGAERRRGVSGDGIS